MESPSSKKISKDNFVFGELLGEGAYSKVVFAQKKDTKDYYAVKIVNKNFIQREGKSRCVLSERNALLRFKHPLINKLHYSFQDTYNLYFVIQYCSGGDLGSMIKSFSKQGKTCPEEIIRFYAAEILITLDYIHNTHHAVHRDLKPENILLQESGHISLSDFGTILFLDDIDPTSTKNTPESKRGRGFTFCGSSCYISPEVLDGEIATPAADLWAFGCILYLLYTGTILFYEENDYLIFEKIAHFSNKTMEFPSSVPAEAQDLIRRLLDKNPSTRLGSSNYQDLFTHPFFHDIDFQSIIQTTPPYHPPSSSLPSLQNDQSLFNEIVEEMIITSDSLSPSETTHTPSTSPKPNIHHQFPVEQLLTNDGLDGELDNEKRRQQAFTMIPAVSKEVIQQGKNEEKNEANREFNGFLSSSEEVLYNGILKKGRCFSFSRRHLVLTTYPRIFCLNLQNGKLEFNILLKQVTNVKYITEGSFSFEDSYSGKTYVFRAIQGDVRMWVETINSMMQFVKGDN